MALRNYLYAKHNADERVSSLINKAPDANPTVPLRRIKKVRLTPTHSTKHPDADIACGSGREVLLENGNKECANCADCPKKASEPTRPKLTVAIAGEFAENDINAQLGQLHLASGQAPGSLAHAY